MDGTIVELVDIEAKLYIQCGDRIQSSQKKHSVLYNFQCYTLALFLSLCHMTIFSRNWLIVTLY